MKLELDTDAKALYLRLAPGRVADTVELAESVVADIDESGETLGIEFIHAEEFAPFLRRHPEVVILPSRLTYVSLDRGKAWEVETGVRSDRPAAERAAVNAMMNGTFVVELVGIPLLLDRIPEGATLILIRRGDPQLPQAQVVELAEQIAREGGTPVVRSLDAPVPKLRRAGVGRVARAG